MCFTPNQSVEKTFYQFFATKPLVVKNVKIFSIFQCFSAWFELGQNMLNQAKKKLKSKDFFTLLTTECLLAKNK